LWVDGYFEKTMLGAIREGDPAQIKLMGYRKIIHGRVGSIGRGINVPNAQPNQQGLATVNPIFTWVRLAQRVPVRIAIDQVPDGVRLVAGMTATVQIDPRPGRPSDQSERNTKRAWALPEGRRHIIMPVRFCDENNLKRHQLAAISSALPARAARAPASSAHSGWRLPAKSSPADTAR
jgi:hypothetical protein